MSTLEPTQPDSQLSVEEMTQSRSAAAMANWAAATIERVGRTKSGTSDIRLRRGLAKQLVEEIYPLGIFAAKLFDASEQVWIQPKLGNQNYDAIVRDERAVPSPIRYIEITQAHEGENEHLRMLHLERHGSVSTIGPVSKTGTKQTGIGVRVDTIARSHSDILAEQLELIRKALANKVPKDYPPGTALVVVFDDYIAMRDDEDRQTLRAFCNPLVPDLARRFCLVAIVGYSKNTFEAFDLAGAAP